MSGATDNPDASSANAPPPSETRHGLLGCGLHAWELGAILTLSLAVFLFWGGALWAAPTGASHVGRILASYLIVVPLVGAGLAVGKRFSLVHLASAVALLWSVKLVLTASLYAYLAPGSASQYVPVQNWPDVPARSAPGETGYQPATAPGALADVAGVVRQRGAPVAGAVVRVEAPPAGLPLAAPHEVRIAIRGNRYDAPIYLASTSDRLVAINGDTQLHTLRVAKDARTIHNLSLPSGGPAAQGNITRLSAGVYQLTCQTHPSERATLVIVDHPYAAVTDAAGRFLLRGVPVGALRVEVLRHAHPAARHPLAIGGARAEVSIDLSEGE